MCQNPTLEELYHHLFTTMGQPRAIFDCLKHDLELWLDHHSLEELPDALEYNLVDPNSDPDADLTGKDHLDHWGVMVTMHPLISMTLQTPLDWAKCFLATYGEYPSLYDLLDTPKHGLLSLQEHLCNSTFPRTLLHCSRTPYTLK